MNDRAVRAMTMLVDGLGDARTATGERLIASQCKPGAFYVTTEHACSCPDSQYRGSVCKHRLALKIERTINEALADERRLERVA